MVNQKTLPQDSPYKFSNLPTPTPANSTPMPAPTNIQNTSTAPMANPIKVEPTLSTKDLSSNLPSTQVVDNSGLVKNIQTTYDKYGGQAGANEAFVRGAIKASGQKETPELIAQYSGKKLGDVISGLGLGEKITGFGITPPTIAPEATKSPTTTVNGKTGETEPEKTPIQEYEDFVNNYRSEKDEAMEGFRDTAEVSGKQKTLLEARIASQDALNEVNKRGLQTVADIEGLKGRAMLKSSFNVKYNDLSNQEKIDLMFLKQDYNNALVKEAIYQDDYNSAVNLVKDMADDWEEDKKLQLDLYAEKMGLDKDQKAELATKDAAEFNKMKDGYLKITTPEEQAKYEQDILSGKADGTIHTDVYGQKWFKPKADDNRLLSIDEAKQLGVPFGTTVRQAQSLGIVPSDFNLGEPPETKTIEGELYQWNGSEQSWVKVPLNKENIDEKKNQARDILNRIDNIIKHPGFKSAVGAKGLSSFFGLRGEPLAGTAAAGALTEINSLKSLLTIDNMGLMKGVLSDADIKILTQAGTSLDVNGREEDFKKELDRLKATAEKALQAETGLTYTSVNDYIRQNPNKMGDVEKMLEENPDLSEAQVVEILNSNFSSVGGDTNKASDKMPNYVSSIGRITGFGSPLWKHGLDIDLKIGDPVPSPVSGSVVKVATNGGFGKQVQIKDGNGNLIWLSHLDGYKVKAGDKIRAGQIIGLGGNTGNTIPGKGGDGSHLDITIKKPNGSYLSAKEVYNYLS